MKIPEGVDHLGHPHNQSDGHCRLRSRSASTEHAAAVSGMAAAVSCIDDHANYADSPTRSNVRSSADEDVAVSTCARSPAQYTIRPRGRGPRSPALLATSPAADQRPRRRLGSRGRRSSDRCVLSEESSYPIGATVAQHRGYTPAARSQGTRTSGHRGVFFSWLIPACWSRASGYAPPACG